MTAVLRLLALVYRYGLRPIWPGGGAGVRQCKFEPTCSAYAVEAVRVHGVRGLGLAVRRVCRCHPWSHGGYDPVSPR